MSAPASRALGRVAGKVTDAFALWLLLGVCWAWLQPAAFVWFKPHITPGLGVIMLGMGITLKLADFRAALRGPRPFLIGVTGQFVIMPLAGWAVAKLLRLDPALAAGLILVASCPGGTASNVISFLARGSVPLSVAMTAASTLAAVGLTPWLTAFYAGSYVPVPVGAMLLDMAAVVLLPVTAGVLLNAFLPALTARLAVFSPVLSVALIVLIIGAIIGGQREAITASGPLLLLAVFALHCAGFGLGYLCARLAGVSIPDRRTISIEIGMQNSGLGAKLAATHFPADPLTAAPAALSAVMHSLIGSLLAAVWRLRDKDAEARLKRRST